MSLERSHLGSFGQGTREYLAGKKKMQNHDGNHDGVITHLEPDNLDCKVQWALEVSLQS